MAVRDIIVIGASAGGVETLPRFFAGLKRDLPAAFFVVLHMAPQSPSIMPRLIARAGSLPADQAMNDTPIESGRIYVAPPDHHLLIEDHRMVLGRGPKENRHRPAIDPLFRTAARHHGPRVVGIVLTGTMDDGSTGLREIKRERGVTIVQDPADALYPDMPRSALAVAQPHFCLSVSKMKSLLPGLIARRSWKPQPNCAEAPELSLKSVRRPLKQGRASAGPSGFVCPECSGPLWRLKEGRYRCRVGHAYAPEAFMEAQSEAMERALWISLRALEERIEMQDRLADRARQHNQSYTAEQFLEKARTNAEHARQLRRMLEKL